MLEKVQNITIGIKSLLVGGTLTMKCGSRAAGPTDRMKIQARGYAAILQVL